MDTCEFWVQDNQHKYYSPMKKKQRQNLMDTDVFTGETGHLSNIFMLPFNVV